MAESPAELGRRLVVEMRTADEDKGEPAYLALRFGADELGDEDLWTAVIAALAEAQSDGEFWMLGDGLIAESVNVRPALADRLWSLRRSDPSVATLYGVMRRDWDNIAWDDDGPAYIKPDEGVEVVPADPSLDAFDRIIASSDQLTARWSDDSASNPSRERFSYVEAIAVANYVLQAMIAGDVEEVARVVGAIEQEFNTTDADVLTWLKVGVIGSIHHQLSRTSPVDRRRVTARFIKELLGPDTRNAWEALDRLWGTSVDDL